MNEKLLRHVWYVKISNQISMKGKTLWFWSHHHPVNYDKFGHCLMLKTVSLVNVQITLIYQDMDTQLCFVVYLKLTDPSLLHFLLIVSFLMIKTTDPLFKLWYHFSVNFETIVANRGSELRHYGIFRQELRCQQEAKSISINLAKVTTSPWSFGQCRWCTGQITSLRQVVGNRQPQGQICQQF